MSAPSLSPDNPRAPRLWRFETSGILRPAVEAYLAGGPLAPSSIALLRDYLRQWIFSPVWDENPAGSAWLDGLRDGINSLTTRAQIAMWIARATEAGIDPL